MRNIVVAGTLALASSLAIAPVAATAVAAAPATTAKTAPSYITKAGASDLYEIESSQLALQKSTRADVKKFAQMMIDHHRMTTREVVAAAAKDRQTVAPPKLDAGQTRMIGELRGASGAAFDTVYLTQQKQAHQMALDLHRSYARSGDKPALKQVAAKAVPIVQKHIAALNAL